VDPDLLFAMLFGLSMDYEVFLVSRMRETWDEVHDNERAVSYGPRAHWADHHGGRDHHGRRVLRLRRRQRRRPAAVRLGLAVAILVDATIVRALLVPALMAWFGRWNWWLPAASRGSCG
jgi:RND superfamily putative drug exporter